MRITICAALWLSQLAPRSSFSQQSRVLRNDSRALITQVVVPPHFGFTLSGDQGDFVWIVLDPATLIKNRGDQRSEKRVGAGDAAIAHMSEQVGFRAADHFPLHLIVVRPKVIQQQLTVSSFALSGGLEDASRRNATLLIAVSTCRFRDTWNLSDESEWVPSKPEVIVMKVGGVKWIAPGIHHFKNFRAAAAKMVSVEW